MSGSNQRYTLRPFPANPNPSPFPGQPRPLALSTKTRRSSTDGPQVDDKLDGLGQAFAVGAEDVEGGPAHRGVHLSRQRSPQTVSGPATVCFFFLFRQGPHLAPARAPQSLGTRHAQRSLQNRRVVLHIRRCEFARTPRRTVSIDGVAVVLACATRTAHAAAQDALPNAVVVHVHAAHCRAQQQ